MGSNGVSQLASVRFVLCCKFQSDKVEAHVMTIVFVVVLKSASDGTACPSGGET